MPALTASPARPSPLSTTTTTTPTATTTTAPAVTSITTFARPQPKKRIMSVTQTYFLAHKARAKLSHEAARSDHDLRLLVGHANLLDSLMLELADAEREQESWFNQSVRGATHHEEEKKAEKKQHIQWADTIVEDPEDDWHADDAESYSSDDSSDSDEYDSESEDVEMADAVSLRRLPARNTNTKPLLAVDEDDYDVEEDDLEEDYAQLELVRTSSHSNSPPELVDEDFSDSSDDDSMPPSPPNTILSFSGKEVKSNGAFAPAPGIFRNSNPANIVSAISVY